VAVVDLGVALEAVLDDLQEAEALDLATLQTPANKPSKRHWRFQRPVLKASSRLHGEFAPTRRVRAYAASSRLHNSGAYALVGAYV
jgi:hypothetical protein